MKIRISYPFFVFLLFCLIIIAAYFYYKPSWGLMDDHNYIQEAKEVWESKHVLKTAYGYVMRDFYSQKIRPLYSLYVLFVYKFFINNTFLVYILIFLAQIIALPIWGIIFHRMFSKEEKISADTLFIYPLTFFLFTPFWNNFIYISLQEKFIFFFTTLSIYYFVSAYEKNNYRQLFISLIFSL